MLLYPQAIESLVKEMEAMTMSAKTLQSDLHDHFACGCC